MAEIIQKKKYSDLPKITGLKDNDMIMVSDGDISSTITVDNLKTEITKDVQVDTTNLATKTELTQGLNSKAEVGHNHDSSYASKASEHSHANKAELDKIQTGDKTKWDAKAEVSAIPTKVSQLTNDSNFANQTQLSAKADKSDTYTISQIDALIDGVSAGDIDLTNYYTISQANAKFDEKSDVDHNHTKADIINFPVLHNVATSGDYNDLVNKPTIPTVTNDLTNALKTNYDTAYTHSQQSHAPSNAEQNVQSDWNISDTSSDAFIKNKPIIPSKTSDLTNDSTFTTEAFVTNKIAEAQLGGGEVDLSGYQAKTDSNLTTTDKTVVGAINENKTQLETITTELQTHITNHPSSTNADMVDGLHFWSGTQAEYDAITTKDPNTVYMVEDDIKEIPNFTSDDGTKILAIKPDGSGLEWVVKPTGGSGSVDLAPYQLKVDNNITGADKNVVNAINSNTDKIDILSTTVGTGTLPTTSQNLKGAITELFQNGNITLRDVVEGEVFTVSGGTTTIYGEIVLNKTTVSITEGGTGTFTVALDKAPTDNQVVTLSKTNADVTLSLTTLTFTPSNFATPQTVTITVAEDNTDYSNESDTITLTSPNVTTKTVSVTITDNDTAPSNIPVTSVSVSPTTATITTIGGTQQLSATIVPSDATNKAVTWSSSDTNIATVDSTGEVTSIANGSATITCTAQDTTNGTKLDSCSITVNEQTSTGGVALYWSANGVTTGTTLEDLSPNSNIATLTSITGLNGDYITIAGTGTSKITNTSLSSNIDKLKNFTIELYTKVKLDVGMSNILKSVSGAINFQKYAGASDKLVFSYKYNPTADSGNMYNGTLNIPMDLNIDEFKHIVVTCSDKIIKAFVNGVEVGTNTQNNSNYIQGIDTGISLEKVQDFKYLRYWDKALSQSEIIQEFNNRENL